MKTKTTKLLAISFVFVFTTFLFNFKKASASEGTAELRSTTQDDYHCYVSSLLMTNGKFNVGVSCVDLLYPPRPPDVSVYMLWATKASNGDPIKIGELGVGKAVFNVKDPFTNLFVTVEAGSNVRSPSNNIVMQGPVEPITFLQRPQSPTPTPTEGDEDTTRTDENTQETTNVSQLSTKDKLVLAFRRAGIAALLALVAIVGLVFVVTRSRG